MKNFRNHLRNDKRREINNELITEGLIKSWDYKDFEKQLIKLLNKHSFTESNILITDIGIKITVDRSEISKIFFDDFINLLKLGGYYISNYYIDRNSDDDFEEKGNPTVVELFSKYYSIKFTINKKFDTKEKGIPLTMYHVSETSYIKSIKKDGLKPLSKNKIEEHPDRIYLFDDVESANFYKSDLEQRFNQYNYIILEIDTKLVNNIILHKDPKFSDFGAFYTYSSISPFAILNF
jgi:hypothetical protein